MNRKLTELLPSKTIAACKGIDECCFAADTLIMTPDCPKPIQSFTEGDAVMTYDLYSGKLIKTLVEKVDLHIGCFNLLEVSIGRQSRAVYSTPGHRFFDGTRWIPCEEMNMTLTGTGELHAAYGFRTDRTAHAVYNLRTQKGTYLVGDEAALVSGGLLKDVQPELAEIIEHASLSHKW